MNRYLNQFRLQFEKRVVDVYGKVTFALGVPTLVQPHSKGLISCTRTATGRYSFLFGTSLAIGRDTYVKLLGVSPIVHKTSDAAPIAPIISVRDIDISNPALCTIIVEFRDLLGARTDPADNETLYIDFCLGDSTAP